MPDTFKNYYTSVKPKIDAPFSELLAWLFETAAVRDIETLVPILGAGKKIRGCMLCLVNQSLDGKLQAALPMAVAVELIQAASLVHDDFVDQDSYRRNRPAVWTLEGARRAVLLGDVLFSTAIKMMSDLGKEACGTVAEAILGIATGALSEPILPETLVHGIASDRYNTGIYETIIALKSGTLFGMACRLGAISCAADGKTQEAFQRYGVKVGEAYQIADDIQEIERHILKRSILPERMALLAPSLLYFAGGLKPQVMAIMTGEYTDLNEEVLYEMDRTAHLMREEIRKKLQSARRELTQLSIRANFKALLEKAPEELITIFNSSAWR